MSNETEVSRSTRAQENRDMEKRKADARKALAMDHQSLLHVDRSEIPDGMEYQWVRTSTYDLPDHSRMIECTKKGFTPVPASRHPDRCVIDFLGTQDKMKGYITHKGLLLCERPKELGDLERAKFDKRNMELLTSLPGTEDFQAGGGRSFINETSVQKTTRSSDISF